VGLEWNLADHYQPNPKQALAHAARADEVFYGGAKGGGKTWCLLWEAFRHCLQWGQDAHAVLFRRTYHELEDTLILEARKNWPEQVGTYVDTKHEFRFNNKALCQFRHLETKDDVQRHFGKQYTFMGLDEATYLESEDMYMTLYTALRSPKNPRIFPRFFTTSNPKGPGHNWVLKRFIEPAEPMHLFQVDGLTRIFIPARVYDNATLMKNDPRYVKVLESLPEADRKAYLHGDWTVFEGQAFTEWMEPLHTCKRFNVPAEWECIRCIDWGYSQNPFHVGWLVRNPSNQEIYLADEWYGARQGPQGGTTGVQMPVKEVAQGINDREVENGLPRPRVTVCDPSMWASKQGELTVADLFVQSGMRGLKKANRDRKVRKQLFHELLAYQEHTGKPGFRVFDHCKGFISTFPQLQNVEKNNDEDVVKCRIDDPYDSVGYGLMELCPNRRPQRLPDVLSEDWRKVLGIGSRTTVPVPI
jgi:hypothetical protein